MALDTPIVFLYCPLFGITPLWAAAVWEDREIIDRLVAVVVVLFLPSVYLDMPSLITIFGFEVA